MWSVLLSGRMVSLLSYDQIQGVLLVVSLRRNVQIIVGALKKKHSICQSPDKTDNIWRRHLWCPLEMTSENRNERRNSILMTRHYPDLGSSSDWLKICFSQLEALPRSGQCRVISMEFLRSFRFSDVISRGFQWGRREMSAVFSG